MSVTLPNPARAALLFQIPYPGKFKNCCICWETVTFAQGPSHSILTATRALETLVKKQNRKLWTSFVVHSSSECPFISLLGFSLLFRIPEGEEKTTKAARSHTSSHLLYSDCCVQLAPLARC